MRKLPPKWGAIMSFVVGGAFFVLVFATNIFRHDKDYTFVRVLAGLVLIVTVLEGLKYWRRGE